MRILVTVPYYKPAYVYGGPSRSVPALCEGLSASGVGVTVYTTDANGSARLDVPLSQAVDVDGVEVWYFSVSPGGEYNFASREQTRAIHSRLDDYDIVIADSVWGQLLGSVHSASRSNQVPYIVSLRGQLMPWALDQKYLKKKMYMTVLGRRYLSAARAFHCTNPREAEEVAKLNLGPPAFVVPNAIDLKLYHSLPSGNNFRRKHGILDDARVMLYLGRLHPNKNPQLCIEVLAQLKDKYPGLVLVIAGPEDGVSKNDLQNMARNFGVTECVKIIGLLQDNETIEALVASNICLIPTIVDESFGMSALESLAAGVPIVVSDTVPVGVWAAKESSALVVPPMADEFSRALDAIFSNEEFALEISNSGRDFVKQNFETTVVARQMAVQLESIIKTGKPLSSSLEYQEAFNSERVEV